ELAQVRGALDYMLAQQEPYPAFVVDRRWNLLRAHPGAGRLLEVLPGPTPPSAEPGHLPLALRFARGVRPLLRDQGEAAPDFLPRVQAGAIAEGTRQTAELLTRLLAFPGLPALSQSPPPGEMRAPVLIIHFRSKETSLRLFTTIATLGTPHDVTLQEI